MRRYDAVLFDVDDTLLDFRASEEAACKRVFDLYPVTGMSSDAFLDAFRKANDITWNLYNQKRVTRADVAAHTFGAIAQFLSMSDPVDTTTAASAFDAAFAQRSIIDFCWYRHHHSDSTASTTPAYVIDSLSDLTDLLAFPDLPQPRSAG